MPTYPGAVHSHHINFPQAITIVVDAVLANESSLFGQGQTIVLRQTPLSGQLQGSLNVGSDLPTKRILYTDTGEDNSFDLKVSYEGWGEWTVEQAEDDNYTLYITKGMTLQAGDWDDEKIFRHTVKLGTKIPTSKNLAGVEPPEMIFVNIDDYVEPPDINDGDTSDGGTSDGDTSDGGTSDGDTSDGDREIVSQRVVDAYDAAGNIIGYYIITTYSDGSIIRDYHQGTPPDVSM